MTLHQDNVVETTGEKPSEDWMARRWRPLMGYVYMVICCCDFIIFPVLWSIMHAILHTGSVTQWNPLTLQGAGLLHLSFGAILGVAAYGRTKEKMAGAEQGGLSTAPSFTPSHTPSFTPSPQAPSFGSVPLGGNSVSTTPSFTPAPPPSFGSKPTGPGRAEQPEL